MIFSSLECLVLVIFFIVLFPVRIFFLYFFLQLNFKKTLTWMKIYRCFSLQTFFLRFNPDCHFVIQRVGLRSEMLVIDYETLMPHYDYGIGNGNMIDDGDHCSKRVSCFKNEFERFFQKLTASVTDTDHHHVCHNVHHRHAFVDL